MHLLHTTLDSFFNSKSMHFSLNFNSMHYLYSTFTATSTSVLLYINPTQALQAETWCWLHYSHQPVCTSPDSEIYIFFERMNIYKKIHESKDDFKSSSGNSGCRYIFLFQFRIMAPTFIFIVWTYIYIELAKWIHGWGGAQTVTLIRYQAGTFASSRGRIPESIWYPWIVGQKLGFLVPSG